MKAEASTRKTWSPAATGRFWAMAGFLGSACFIPWNDAGGEPPAAMC